MLFCRTRIFLYLVKMQIPSSSGTRDTCLFLVVWRQLESAFFGALTSVGALFVLLKKEKENGRTKQAKFGN